MNPIEYITLWLTACATIATATHTPHLDRRLVKLETPFKLTEPK